jgi:glycosyltransferase involved in cell wall biosynthesis
LYVGLKDKCQMLIKHLCGGSQTSLLPRLSFVGSTGPDRGLGMEPAVSVVVPVYNEAGIIRMNTEKLRGYLGDRLADHEIILCENGSTDGTAKMARDLAEEFDDVEYLELPDRSLGEALKVGVEAARSEKVVYFPIDLSVDLGFIHESARLLDMFDVVIGSKRMGAGLDNRPIVRRVPSMAFHGMVRSLFGVEFTDSTCVKAYKRDKILDLMDRVPPSSRVFETEVMVEAERAGLYIAEVPVVVGESRQSRELLGRKIQRKLEDLLSARLDRISLMVGVPFFAAGLLGILLLTYVKLSSTGFGGFVNPYAFLISMLLVISGFQIITLGLLSRLIMQIRRQIFGALNDRG